MLGHYSQDSGMQCLWVVDIPQIQPFEVNLAFRPTERNDHVPVPQANIRISRQKNDQDNYASIPIYLGWLYEYQYQ